MTVGAGGVVGTRLCCDRVASHADARVAAHAGARVAAQAPSHESDHVVLRVPVRPLPLVGALVTGAGGGVVARETTGVVWRVVLLSVVTAVVARVVSVVNLAVVSGANSE